MIGDFLNRHRAGVLLVAYLFLSTLCMTLNIDRYVVGVKTVAWYFFSPNLVYSGEFFNKLDSLRGGLFRLVRVDGENFILREQNALLAKKDLERDALERENLRLRELLDLKQKQFPEAIAAEVTGRDVRDWFQSVVIDKGEADGIVYSAAVVTGMTDKPSLIGRIVEADKKSSKVLLITDAVSAVSATVLGKDDIGLIEGKSKPWVWLNYLAQNSQVAPGDQIVTAGLGGVFPPGIPIGLVESVQNMPDGYFKSAKVIPSSAMNSLREVLVLHRKTVEAPQ